MSFGKFKDPKESEHASDTPKKGETAVNDSPRSDFKSGTKAYLGRGSKLVGKITFEEPAEIDGSVDGEVYSNGHLTIGKSALVKAKIGGQEIVVMGTVEGDINAAKRLALKQSARVKGNISTPVLSVEEGVVFDGGCHMQGGTDKGKS